MEKLQCHWPISRSILIDPTVKCLAVFKFGSTQPSIILGPKAYPFDEILVPLTTFLASGICSITCSWFPAGAKTGPGLGKMWLGNNWESFLDMAWAQKHSMGRHCCCPGNNSPTRFCFCIVAVSVSATETTIQDFWEFGQVLKWDVRASEAAETQKQLLEQTPTHPPQKIWVLEVVSLL